MADLTSEQKEKFDSYCVHDVSLRDKTSRYYELVEFFEQSRSSVASLTEAFNKVGELSPAEAVVAWNVISATFLKNSKANKKVALEIMCCAHLHLCHQILEYFP